MIKVYNHKLKEIMELDINTYLKGVVAFEVPASFAMEALKAQAVVARTYSLNKLKKWINKIDAKHPETPLCTDSGHCQGWYSEEDLKTKWGTNFGLYLQRISQAVEETGLEVIYHQNTIIDAVFHSTCGGKTEDAQNIWGSDLPYLKSVACEFCQHSPRYRGRVEISLPDLEKKLEVSLPELFKVDLNSNGRVDTLNVNTKSLTGREVRSTLGLDSTWFTPTLKVVFETKGFGHGVGMCQYGADGQAKAGKNYREIAQYYYQGTVVREVLPVDKELLSLTKEAPAVITVQNIRSGIFDQAEDKKERSRVVIELSGPIKDYQVNTLSEPERIYIDLKNSKLEGENRNFAVNDGLLKTIRVSQFEATTVRIVLDVVKKAAYDTFTLGLDNTVKPPVPYRLVIDVLREADPTPTPVPTPKPTSPPQMLKGKSIVLDPGHGGKDSGAVGINGLQEKNVVLDVALRLYKLLTAAGAKVMMIRTSDAYLPLSTRSTMANKSDADIYVSIHNNAANDSSAHGLETFHYYNSTQGNRLASAIQKELVAALGWRDRGIKTAGFHVLKYTDMYAALAEIGFITNLTEGKFLADGNIRQKAAEAMFKGILNYFQ